MFRCFLCDDCITTNFGVNTKSKRLRKRLPRPNDARSIGDSTPVERREGRAASKEAAL